MAAGACLVLIMASTVHFPGHDEIHESLKFPAGHEF